MFTMNSKVSKKLVYADDILGESSVVDFWQIFQDLLPTCRNISPNKDTELYELNSVHDHNWKRKCTPHIMGR